MENYTKINQKKQLTFLLQVITKRRSGISDIHRIYRCQSKERRRKPGRDRLKEHLKKKSGRRKGSK